MATDFEIALNNRVRNDYYLSVAKTIAFGSPCPDGKQHGAIAVKFARMVSTGYNGPASGMPHCGEECPLDVYKRENDGKKDFSLCPAVHAEINTIVTAAMIGTALRDAVIYVTKRPCENCLKALRNLHISGVVYDHDDDNGEHLLLLGPKLVQEMTIVYD